jgi:UDP-N-acetylglucosamine:LPS N-acetylglucosamine transferase
VPLLNNKKINILGIAPYRFLPAVNGGHKGIEQLYRNIGKYAETIVVSTKSNSEEYAVNYRLIKLFSNSFLRYINVFYYFKLKALIREQKITHVILEHPYMGWLAFLLKQSTNVSLIVRSHNIEAIRFQTIKKWWWKALWYYEKWVYNIADKVCFVTIDDKEYAVNHFHLSENKCIIKTYGTDLSQPPPVIIKQKAKAELQHQHNIHASDKIILFNGGFSYQPNLDALYHLLNTIQPLLDKNLVSNYTILICGINIPEDILRISNDKIVIAGFVKDVNAYFLGADIFVCPITAGGGIKTKLVEALAYDDTCVSYSNSAIGIDEEVCNGKLLIAEDNNAEQFVSLIQHAMEINTHITDEFYEKYSALSSARHLLKAL